MDAPNLQLCRICITNSNCAQMISIFGEDSLWKKITVLADVQIEKDDTLPQQVCITCAKNAISACLFKKKCEDADNFFRQQLLIRKIEGKTTGKVGGNDVITLSEEDASENEQDPEENVRNNDTDNDEDDGEIKMENDEKQPAFDFNSIRLMHEYMQQHLSKINSNHSAGSGSDALGDDDEPLPLIPEIELLTPSEEVNANVVNPNVGNSTQIRGYQCTICFQIFEMKQILKHHMQSVHGTCGPVYECTNCKKTYFYKRFLEKHVRRGRCVKKRRNQTRPMQCSDCHVLFPTGHHLGWHKRTGCPSRAAKMPLQQLFKQNIVQYNNFPKRVGIRKPENAIYLHNRKLIMANNKRKGRTRIKLDAKKIALAKQLILREATTTVIANELNISRTFAWRLRKSLVNGVSLHERVIDPTSEEHVEGQEAQAQEQPEQYKHDETVCIKSEQMESASGDDDSINKRNSRDVNNGRISIETSSEQINDEDDIDEADDDSEEADEDEAETDERSGKPVYANNQDQFMQQRAIVHTEQTQLSDDNGVERVHKANNYKVYPSSEHPQELMFKNTLQQAIPMLNGFPAAVAAAIHQLPVNLSIKPIASMQNAETNNSSQLKKPRKPNVFIDDEKYAMAKMLVAQNSSTMEIARQLNVSQMTAWKVRDAIVKGIPLSYRSKHELRATYQPEILKTETSMPSQQQFHHQQQPQQLIRISQSTQQIVPAAPSPPQPTPPPLPPPLSSSSQQQHRQPEPTQQPSSSATKAVNPRRRLKAAERELRDKEITREILEMIKEDSNIQYWKVSARLAEKGYPISPSSVCQKLKSMGIHRRWKPGDKPPMLDLEQLKANGIVAHAPGVNESFDYNNSNEQQFDMGGAHFLSAFTR